MEKQLGVITAEHTYLRSGMEESDGRNRTGIEDEIFAGWAIRILQENPAKDFVKVETHYGYTGYVDRRDFRRVTRKELEQRQDKERFLRIQTGEADLLDQPKVQGLPLELLLKNSIVELLEREVAEGWSKVRSASGREGYIHTQNLKRRMDHDGYLLTEEKKADYFQNWENPVCHDGLADEEVLRERLEDSAREFLGTQYRWGGKSSQGIDCSGLVFMSYLDQGILIYRDADIKEAYPVKRIPVEQLKKGDLLFFPGHVAMYLGEGKYIHATGYYQTPYVTINSLKKSDPDYRPDLAGNITECGSIFV